MTREYGGTKTMETRGGATLSNRYWTKQPNWANGNPAWSLISGTETFSPFASSGRRIWDLSFSYLDKEDVFPAISTLSWNGFDETFIATLGTSGNTRDYAFMNSNANRNFFSDVIHKTNGGTLPFVFQADSSNANPDQFAICMFDQDSFQFKQVANSVYNIKLKIREVW
tara:strand:- start:8062 stop:8568 length:507 start_codon:yes stop_codon:yes gene_type:complete